MQTTKLNILKYCALVLVLFMNQRVLHTQETKLTTFCVNLYSIKVALMRKLRTPFNNKVNSLTKLTDQKWDDDAIITWQVWSTLTNSINDQSLHVGWLYLGLRSHTLLYPNKILTVARVTRSTIRIVVRRWIILYSVPISTK